MSIKAGKHTIKDNGFVSSVERLGGVSREALVMELPSGISKSELAAICAGPIEVLDEQGQVVRTHTGPFQVVSHSLKLVREGESSDVAALTARVASLEAELSQARSEKNSALGELASLSEQLQTIKGAAADVITPGLGDKVVVRDGADSLS